MLTLTTMKLEKVQHGDHTTIFLGGRFDAHQVPAFKNSVEPLSASTELDFQEVHFIDSTALAALVALYKQAQAHDKALSICNLQDAVRLIFEITKLDMVLPLKP